jgi:hypothetical protein
MLVRERSTRTVAVFSSSYRYPQSIEIISIKYSKVYKKHTWAYMVNFLNRLQTPSKPYHSREVV